MGLGLNTLPVIRLWDCLRLGCVPWDHSKLGNHDETKAPQGFKQGSVGQNNAKLLKQPMQINFAHAPFLALIVISALASELGFVKLAYMSGCVAWRIFKFLFLNFPQIVLR